MKGLMKMRHKIKMLIAENEAIMDWISDYQVFVSTIRSSDPGS